MTSTNVYTYQAIKGRTGAYNVLVGDKVVAGVCGAAREWQAYVLATAATGTGTSRPAAIAAAMAAPQPQPVPRTPAPDNDGPVCGNCTWVGSCNGACTPGGPCTVCGTGNTACKACGWCYVCTMCAGCQAGNPMCTTCDSTQCTVAAHAPAPAPNVATAATDLAEQVATLRTEHLATTYTPAGQGNVWHGGHRPGTPQCRAHCAATAALNHAYDAARTAWATGDRDQLVAANTKFATACTALTTYRQTTGSQAAPPAPVAVPQPAPAPAAPKGRSKPSPALLALVLALVAVCTAVAGAARLFALPYTLVGRAATAGSRMLRQWVAAQHTA